MRVLVVEDSPLMRESIREGLEDAGMAVDAVGDGKRALIQGQTTEYAAIVLDWMLPEMDGITVLTKLRAKGVQTYVLMLTAKDTLEDKLRGFGGGADDYLVKPFSLAELVARLRAIEKRRLGARLCVISVGPLRVDTNSKSVSVEVGGRTSVLQLTRREYSVLEYLAMRRGAPVHRSELEEQLYDDRSQVLSNSIDSAVCAIRHKLERAGAPPMIRTRRRVGYVLEEAAE